MKRILIIIMVCISIVSCEKDNVLIEDTSFKVYLGNYTVDYDNERLLINSNRQIKVIDYLNSTIIDSLGFSSSIGHFAMGNFNNTSELYIPLSGSNKILIYSANDLVKTDSILLSKSPKSVVCANNYLFVSVFDPQCNNCIDKPLLVIDRGTKQIINEIQTYEDMKLNILASNDNEIEILAVPRMSWYIIYFLFDSSGGMVEKKTSASSIDYDIAWFTFCSNKSENVIVTSSSGTILDLDFNYKNSLSNHYDSLYKDFFIDSKLHKIMGAFSDKKVIYEFDYLGNYQKEIELIGYPYRLFQDKNGGIYSISSIDNFGFYQEQNFFIEKIKY